ncbi:hypothetical protein BGX34_008732 [Mortierella sp. NVP85]|nr:hypothetical protein BGX34_008732 [Mortierella sp. NVP85]
MGKEVIQIAYIPSVVGDTPVLSPQPSMQQSGVLRPDFSSLKAEERNKHTSVSSVDEAVVMAVTAKATPQVMKLGAIKATQSDLIQRSNNTLHSTNTVQRSKSQRKPTEKGAHRPSPLAGQQASDGGSDGESEDDTENPFMSDAELAMSTNNTRNSNITRTPSTYSDNPFLSQAEARAISSLMSTPPDTPMSETTVFASVPIEDQQYDPLEDLAGGGVKLRPWAGGSGSGPLRDSTFSTMSDGRSSTRGDGEEIMIFWDGHRDSRTNL